ncbi:EAL domain-containing protein [Roseospira navarrensis]|uniref:EAL domain-containing protein n=1 Tax=Roseospira navarrensis TaxID=140058 RepID=A0A7X2D478_9PROT|nr:EAL domain-containing protein [Roseospira navarrensis]MQX38139.1 EAL domain-containing protein [Roseospira navarrensis]
MCAQACPRCEQIPDAPHGDGRLFVWPPLGHTAGKLRRALTAANVVPETQDGALVVPVTGDSHQTLATVMDAAITLSECRDSRSLFLRDGEQPSVAHLAQVMGLDAYIARAKGGWLLDMIGSGRVRTLFQPIFHVADPSRVFAHECLLRGVGPEGNEIPPGEIFDIARRADLLFALDRLARTTHVANAAASRVPGHIFINFTPSAVYDPAFCLRTTVAAVEKAGLDRSRIVFEVIETELINDAAHLAGVLRYYRDAGFKIALDDLGGGYASLGLLPTLKPDFVKLDRSLVDGVHTHPIQSVVIERLVQMAHDLDILIVAEGVEQAEDLAWLQTCGADFVQGFLLARPAPAPLVTAS